MGGQTYPQYLEELYRFGATLTPNHRLVRLQKSGNVLVAQVKNMFTRQVLEWEYDHVILEQGTIPVPDLFDALSPLARNKGITDWDALADANPQSSASPKEGAFDLFAIGDAVSSRNIHAAMFDANRIARAI